MSTDSIYKPRNEGMIAVVSSPIYLGGTSQTPLHPFTDHLYVAHLTLSQGLLLQ